MKVVVTGASGHVGRALVRELASHVQEGHEVHEVIAASRAGVALEGASRPLALDVTRDDCVPRLRAELGEQVALVHLAALHPPSTWSTGPAERRALFETNVRGTMRVLEAARRAPGVPGASVVVYASSFEVYGEVSGDAPIDERARVTPMTDYGATKLAGEDHLLAFAYEERTRVVALRMPAIYGPGERTPRALPNFLAKVARGERPRILGDGSDLRDQLHVRDAARALLLAITSTAQGIFNVADGAPHSIAELARLALEVSGLGGEPEYAPREKRRVDCHMQIDAARVALGFSPSITLREGMAEQLASLRATESR